MDSAFHIFLSIANYLLPGVGFGKERGVLFFFPLPGIIRSVIRIGAESSAQGFCTRLSLTVSLSH